MLQSVQVVGTVTVPPCMQAPGAVFCSVLRFVAVCCSVMQCVVVCCSVLQCVAVCCSVLQCVVVCWHSHDLTEYARLVFGVLQSVAVC